MSAFCSKMNALWVYQLIKCIWPDFLFHQTEWWFFFSIWQDAYLWCRWFGLLPVSSLRGRRTSSNSVPQQKAGRYECRDSSSSGFRLKMITHTKSQQINLNVFTQTTCCNRDWCRLSLPYLPAAWLGVLSPDPLAEGGWTASLSGSPHATYGLASHGWCICRSNTQNPQKW